MKKFFERNIATDCDTKLTISSTQTSIVTAGGRETPADDGAAIILQGIVGEEVVALLNRAQLRTLIRSLKELQRYLVI